MTIETAFRAAHGHRTLTAALTTRTHFVALVILLEWLAFAVCAHAAFVTFRSLAHASADNEAAHTWIAVATASVYVMLCLADEQYDLLSRKRDWRINARGAVATVLAFALVLAFEFARGAPGELSRDLFLTQFLCALCGASATRAILWRMADDAEARGLWQRERMAVLVLPDEEEKVEAHEALSSCQDRIVRYFYLARGNERPSDSVVDDRRLTDIRRECGALDIETVVVMFGSRSVAALKAVVSELSMLPVRIQLVPIEMNDYLRRNEFIRRGDLSVVELPGGHVSSIRDRVLKRVFDVVVSIAMLLALWPILLLVAVLIKMESPGPVLFRQTRVGFKNQYFKVLKFRSMITFDESRDQFRQAVRNDARVTRIGRFIRRTNIDELPQLFNVLRGDMSIVGPRPHAVAHIEMFAHRIRSLPRRHIVKPGITGWAQVNGLRGETDTLEKMQRRIDCDLFYIDNWSFFLDVKIVLMTAVLKSVYANAY